MTTDRNSPMHPTQLTECPRCSQPLTYLRRTGTKNVTQVCSNHQCGNGVNVARLTSWERIAKAEVEN